MHGWISDIEQTANAEHNTPDDVLRIFFEITDSSRQAGREYLSRAFARTHSQRPAPRVPPTPAMDSSSSTRSSSPSWSPHSLPDRRRPAKRYCQWLLKDCVIRLLVGVRGVGSALGVGP
jgi:hypothetical protein